jgi:DedD protein
MESRAKQRITGAVILVALVVLLVPELLTGPRQVRPPADSATEEGLRRYTIDLESPGSPTAPAAGGEAPAVALPAPDQAPATPGLAKPGEAAAPSVATPEATASRTPAPANPASVASAPTAQPARPQSVAPASAATPPAARGSFVVQLGTFSKRENADRLVRDMTARGFAAFVVPTTSNGHALYRVRVGPTRDRPSAEALAAQLKRAGQSGSIVPIS